MDLQQKFELSLSMVLTGLAVVLVVFTYIMKTYDQAMYNFSQKKKEAQVIMPIFMASTPITPVLKAFSPTEGNSSDGVIAAIVAAVHSIYGGSALVIHSVKRTSLGVRSVWGQAGRVESTHPF